MYGVVMSTSGENFDRAFLSTEPECDVAAVGKYDGMSLEDARAVQAGRDATEAHYFGRVPRSTLPEVIANRKAELDSIMNPTDELHDGYDINQDQPRQA
jgi:hypothetical protein